MHHAEKETKEFFKKTLLSEEDCAQILQLSDMDQDGRLTVSEFILAVHYIKAKLLGLSLPDAVPQGLKQKVMPFNLPPASDEHIAKCRLALLDHRQLVNENGMLPGSVGGLLVDSEGCLCAPVGQGGCAGAFDLFTPGGSPKWILGDWY